MKHKLATLALIAGTIFSTTAMANPHNHHGHGGSRSNFSFSIQLGSPYLYPVYPRYYHSAPVYIAPRPIYIEQPAPVFIERAPAPVFIERAPAPAPKEYWYYCPDTRSYYPTVQSCDSPWQKIIPLQ